MKKKSSLTLDDEFLEYCRLNNINDVEKLAKDTFNRGFTILKYGETPFGLKPTEKIVEKEVVKEVIVEVEKIVNVEVIKEVPVNVKGETEIITKEIKVVDTEEIDKLKKQLQDKQEEINKLNDALNKFNKATFMKNSNLNTLYDE
jgi:hypothetical protein